MGFGFAGAMAGIGSSLQKWAEEQRKLAADLTKMEKAEEMRREGLEWNKANGVGRGGGSGRGGGAGGGGAGGGGGRALTPQERDDLKRYYDSDFPEDDLGGDPRPTLGEYASWIENNWQDGESFSQVTDRARKAWQVRDETTETEVPRAGLSPMRLLGDDTYTKVDTRRVGGFDTATQDTPAPAAEPAAPAARPAAGTGMSEADKMSALEEARRAIAAGAPRDKVIARLKANGIDPTGL